MNLFTLELYLENIGGENNIKSWCELRDYEKYHFNDDVNYCINNLLDSYKYYKEKEVRELINNHEINFNRLEILKGVGIGKDYVEYHENIIKLIDNIVDVYKL